MSRDISLHHLNAVAFTIYAETLYIFHSYGRLNLRISFLLKFLIQMVCCVDLKAFLTLFICSRCIISKEVINRAIRWKNTTRIQQLFKSICVTCNEWCCVVLRFFTHSISIGTELNCFRTNNPPAKN